MIRKSDPFLGGVGAGEKQEGEENGRKSDKKKGEKNLMGKMIKMAERRSKFSKDMCEERSDFVLLFLHITTDIYTYIHIHIYIHI